ncbi:hypothetical protein TraAM80_09450 [Trypanosoma rangeli]|uniref:Uncharacterized protein n=1 Tax=Trypanosoma rangeli TaxID=5698 RepID=A0A422MVU4_TRYRA|nr:uncharacterized protein TraAM80_09450 [Trypanosoma rangeli]RNE97358.1 hypothetical protein TraAM80_09450 [Trypanosoma rangeli]|eukprot:RNE97358.1 hypothetical protein TraAM80_09450 [Trypanosoma rangeli]
MSAPRCRRRCSNDQSNSFQILVPPHEGLAPPTIEESPAVRPALRRRRHTHLAALWGSLLDVFERAPHNYRHRPTRVQRKCSHKKSRHGARSHRIRTTVLELVAEPFTSPSPSPYPSMMSAKLGPPPAAGARPQHPGCPGPANPKAFFTTR